MQTGAPTRARRDPRIAVVHEWLITLGGSELVLAQLLRAFPGADVFALIDKLPASERSLLGLGRVRTSFLQALPRIEKRYRSLLPLFPAAVRGLDVRDYDIVISSSHAVAKGVKTYPGQLHVCYCHSPMRYAWDLREQYLMETGNDRGPRGFVVRTMLDGLKRWDRANSADVDSFVANSRYIADRIRRAYDREAAVIYPPVDTEFFTPSASRHDTPYYVTASRFVPYKRMDLIAAAFRLLPDRRLVIVGNGPDEAKVRAAAGANVEFAGHVDRERLRDLLRGARAFVFAANEDFGIAPVEAQACGTPVIAYGRGGATETVVSHGPTGERTGVLFPEQTTESIVEAIQAFETLEISSAVCRANAERFGEERFRREIAALVAEGWRRHESVTPAGHEATPVAS
jgi:glycosyltransferase involved in cell wall biosynthesis